MKDRVRAKKKLGQHFLIHTPTAGRIVDALKVVKSDIVLEIGPGMGVLTGFLLKEYGEKLWAVEIDQESVDYLNVHFPELAPRIVREDFLKTDMTAFAEGQIAVIGNFPYNISSQILFHLLEHRHRIAGIAGMFQREVARRLTSGPGSKEYGILSVLMSAYFDSEYLFTVNEDMFRPPPKVKSGVIRFTRKSGSTLPCSSVTLHKVVKMAFNQRRKTLRNALSAIWIPELEETGFGGLRAEQLGVEEFCRIGETLEGIRD